jgi:hypothetical protein
VKKPPPLPGECIPIPKVVQRVRDLQSRSEWTAETHSVPGLDLDGCASPVVVVPAVQANPTLETFCWRLFILRGECGHELGLIGGVEDPLPLSEKYFGLRSFYVIETATPEISEDLLQGLGTTIYRFDGSGYVAGRTEYI